MSDRFRGMPFTSEVDAFEREVGGHQRVEFLRRSSLETENSAVVSYSNASATRPRPHPASGDRRHAANLGDQQFLRQWHGSINIKEPQEPWVSAKRT